MKVLVFSTMLPFVHGDHEELFAHLVRNLQSAGVEAEGFRIPFSWNPAERLVDEMLITRQMRLYHIDRVIALKFPSYLVPWNDKVLWLLHQHRQAYDLFDAGQGDIPDDAGGARIVHAVRTADNAAFAESRRIFANAPATANRLLHYNGVASEVLRPPLNQPELFGGGRNDGYVLATGRIDAANRQHLLVEALRFAPTARLVIAGAPDSPEDAQRLRRVAEEAGVGDRVQLELRTLSREERAGLVNHALAVACLPSDESSLGYGTMEAFHAGKAVITTPDADGASDLVRHQENGWVCAAEAEALGGALSAIAANSARAERWGREGRASLDALGLNWPATVEKLVS